MSRICTLDGNTRQNIINGYFKMHVKERNLCHHFVIIVRQFVANEDLNGVIIASIEPLV